MLCRHHYSGGRAFVSTPEIRTPDHRLRHWVSRSRHFHPNATARPSRSTHRNPGTDDGVERVLIDLDFQAARASPRGPNPGQKAA
jgi:hypothetical protein